MRKEIFSVGSYVHIVHRGARGGDIVRDDSDRRRFLKLLKYLNDENAPRNWEREIRDEHIRSRYDRPDEWPEPKPYVSVLAYCLLDNHFHLLVREEQEAGISRFMQRLCTSMASHFNTRHEEKGSLFQGPFRANVIDSDEYLQYVSAYIQVKNGFERRSEQPRSFEKKFDELFEETLQDPFVSLGEYMNARDTGLVHLDRCREVLMKARDFREFASDVIAGRTHLDIID